MNAMEKQQAVERIETELRALRDEVNPGGSAAAAIGSALRETDAIRRALFTEGGSGIHSQEQKKTRS